MVDLLGIDNALSFHEFAYQPPASDPHLGKKNSPAVASKSGLILGCHNMLHWWQLLFHGKLLTGLQNVSWILMDIIMSFWLKHVRICIYPFSFLSSMSSICRESRVNPLQSTVDEIVTELFNLLSTGQVSWLNSNLGQLIQQNVFNVDGLNVDLSWCTPWS